MQDAALLAGEEARLARPPFPSPRPPPRGATKQPRALQLAARLCRALRGRDEAMVAALLQEGADPNLVLPEGVAPMHLAAGLEQENGTRHLCLLLQHGGDPNVRSGEGLTPVHVAASWGCTACLRLLLAEGGDPQLEDQDGNRAFDLALEQGNEMCVGILQDGGWNSGSPQRRLESFLSTIMEDAGATGLGDSLPSPSDRPSSWKEARQHGEPPGTFPPNGGPGPCTQDRSPSSFLTECSWQGNTIWGLADFGVWPVEAPNGFPSPGTLPSSRANAGTCWGGEGGRSLSGAGIEQSWDIQASAEGGGRSPLGPDTAPLSSVGRPDRPGAVGSPRKAQPSASLSPEPEPAQLCRLQEAKGCGLSQGCGSLDLGLLERLPSQDGLDVTCRDHLAESTAVLDVGKEAVGLASVLGVSGTLDGCSARGRSPGRCSAASTDRYLSCISECYTSAVEDLGHGCLPAWEGWAGASSSPAGGCLTSHGGSGRGPPACLGRGLGGQSTLPTRGEAQIFPGSQDLALAPNMNSWEVSQGRGGVAPPENGAPGEGPVLVTGGPTETRGLPVEGQGPVPSAAGGEELAEAGPRWSRPRSALPTSPQPGSSPEDTRPVRWRAEEGQGLRGHRGPPGPSSTAEGAPCPPACLGEEPPSTLEAQLRSMRLPAKAGHPPLLPSCRKCCPGPTRPQSPPMGTLPQQSLSAASLLEEPLEMPRRVRRSPGPGSPRGGAAGLPAREAEETGEARAPSPPPTTRKPSSNPGPCSLGGGEASRVSFSRLSGRSPPAPGPPGRLSAPRQEVPLSPGGRPVPLSTPEPVEHLYVDEEGGQSLIERHLPPTDDSGPSSSEGSLAGDWQEAGGSGAGAPLNPEHLTDRALVLKLRQLGADPGPVTPLTRGLYVRLLERLSGETAETPGRKGPAAYSPELTSALHTYRIPPSQADEMALAAEFDQPDKNRRWREGLLKSSFNYLLLDPRVTRNLPARCQLLSPAEAFQTFVQAVFYVGKGTRGRPYRHLYEALSHYQEGQGTPATQVSSKVRHILEIWAGGQGVVSMHCFQNVVPVEAYTREACMVDAIGLRRLTNQKKGNYYGSVAGWPMKRRRSLGVFLLHRALRIFLAEGERQLRPADI
ncbi:collagen alpha-1(I) chain-like [Pseudonaja textilis]|nr:collagen alpha-1(I) chain-like [Pseudonaja textilis]